MYCQKACACVHLNWVTTHLNHTVTAKAVGIWKTLFCCRTCKLQLKWSQLCRCIF